MSKQTVTESWDSGLIDRKQLGGFDIQIGISKLWLSPKITQQQVDIYLWSICSDPLVYINESQALHVDATYPQSGEYRRCQESTQCQLSGGDANIYMILFPPQSNVVCQWRGMAALRRIMAQAFALRDDVTVESGRDACLF